MDRKRKVYLGLCLAFILLMFVLFIFGRLHLKTLILSGLAVSISAALVMNQMRRGKHKDIRPFYKALGKTRCHKVLYFSIALELIVIALFLAKLISGLVFFLSILAISICIGWTSFALYKESSNG